MRASAVSYGDYVLKITCVLHFVTARYPPTQLSRPDRHNRHMHGLDHLIIIPVYTQLLTSKANHACIHFNVHATELSHKVLEGKLNMY